MFKIQPQNSPETAQWLVKKEQVIANVGTPDIFCRSSRTPPFSVTLISLGSELFIDDIPASITVRVNQRTITHKTALNHQDTLSLGDQIFQIFNAAREVQKLSTPAPQNNGSRYWQLQSLTNPNKCFFLAPYTVIGRKPQCDIFINHASLMDEHVAMSVVGGKIIMKDLSITSHCFVNGLKQTDAILDDGDEITLGTLPFRLIAPAKKTRSLQQKQVPITTYSHQDKTPEVQPEEKIWKTKPTSNGNRENDHVDQLLKRHKRFKTLTALTFFASLIGMVCTGLYFTLNI